VIAITPEAPGQRQDILALNREAFGGSEEAEIIEKLTEAGLVTASLVAMSNSHVVGHILFSDLAVEVDGRKLAAVALAPLAVKPANQNSGIGTRLVEAGIAAMRKAGIEAIIVLGHPAYYRRFGFASEAVAHIASPFSGNDAFMGLELVPRALTGRDGTCRYPDVFGIPDDAARQR